MALANIQKHTKTQNEMCKPKPAVPRTSVRTAHICVLITVYNCGVQYSTEQFKFEPCKQNYNKCLPLMLNYFKSLKQPLWQ